MIQLPSRIRTTLFSCHVDPEPFLLFSREDDRIFVIFYPNSAGSTNVCFGRSGQDASNAVIPNLSNYFPLYLYGPEPIWIALSSSLLPQPSDTLLVHAIYRT